MLKHNYNYNYRIFDNIQYGSDIYHAGDLYIPEYNGKGIICLLHGGFWKMPYDKTQFNKVAERLVKIGFVVWNIEYRRVDYSGAGYPGTFTDIVEAINYLEQLTNRFELKKQKVFIAGHSAGGQLALWLGSNANKINMKPFMVIGLAPVVDLEKCYESIDRKNFVYALLKCSPAENAQLYKTVSPICLLANIERQAIIYCENDEALPASEIEDYIKKCRDFDGIIEIAKIDKGGHMDFIDSNSKAIDEFIKILEENCA
jgi:acetyl esterase/lipase